MSDRAGIEALALHRCGDFRWIDPKEIVVSQWVRRTILAVAER